MMPNYGSDYPNMPYNKSVNTNQLPPSNTTPSPYSFLADIVKELISKESQKLQLQPYVVWELEGDVADANQYPLVFIILT